MNEKRSDARNRYSSSEVVDDASTAVGLADGTPGSILIATNGSPVGDAALHFAIALAKREDVPLRIITVLEPLPVLPSELVASGHHMIVERDRGEKVLTHARAQATTALESPLVETGILIGAPAATIAAAARSWRCGYVILGAGRRRTLGRLLSGDTVVRVLRETTVPVIAVSQLSAELPRTAVVAVDFGPASLHAARAAAAIVDEGTIHLVHVRPEVDIPATDPVAWAEVYETGARNLLANLAAELRSQHRNVRIEVALSRGHAAEVLLECAHGLSADLIAVGQHAHGVVERLLFGSVANGIMRGAQCAVLVAPIAGVNE